MFLQRAIFFHAFLTTIRLLLIVKLSVAKSAVASQPAALTESEIEKACYNFTVGNSEKKVFYSPNYPGNYPKDIKCTKQITADFGHVVQLDFRDQFKLEGPGSENTCEYDVLTVRDGPYGYSQEIAKLCGSHFPNVITSSDRYLWLQFTSDESIEYTGFRAVYDFIPVKGVPKQTDECVFNKMGQSGIIRKKEVDISRYEYAKLHEVPIDCIWIITADHPKKQIYINFVNFSLEYPNECEKNFVDIYPKSRLDSKIEARFCGTQAEPLMLQSHIAHVRLFMDLQSYNDTDFNIHYTTFRALKKGETCDSISEFNCGDQTCIDNSLKCNHFSDCKYHYDEEASMCGKSHKSAEGLGSEHMIVILVVFFALVIAMCASISVSCYNKIQDRKIREREYRERRSKEHSVEATIDRSIRTQPTPDLGTEPSLGSQTSKGQRVPRTHYPDDGDDESSDGCYVPEVNISNFQKYPNGGGTIPRGADGRSVSRGGIQSNMTKQQYPFISHSTESIESDTIVPPAPPPVPMHLKDRPVFQQRSQPTYKFFEGKAIPESVPSDSRFKPKEDTGRSTLPRARWPPEQKTSILDKPSTEPRTYARGPLEAGAPRSAYLGKPGDYGLPRFGMARANPETSRGPLSLGTDKVLPLSIYRPPESYSNTPYKPNTYRDYKERLGIPQQYKAQAKIETISDRDSSRADSVDSIQSAPDVVAQR